MNSLKKDTLAYQLGVRPYTQRVKHTAIAVPTVAAKIKSARAANEYSGKANALVHNKVVAHPEADALQFYFMNHAVAVASKKVHPYESLGELQEVFDTYNKVMAEQTRRMFYYLLTICTRESRHNSAESLSSFWVNAKAQYGTEVVAFFNQIKGKSSMSAADEFCDEPPMLSLGQYTDYLVDAFYKGKYSSSFGGKAWGAIADVLTKFVHGDYSAEMMLDTAYTLCHNNGPIFNKGMFYEHYSSEIYKILDVQRSGQIPQLINDSGTGKAMDKTVYPLFVRMRELLGDDLFSGTPYVDWFKVEAMGALKTYTIEKDKQVKKYGPVVENVGIDYAEVNEPPKGLEIMPGVFVQQVEAERNE